MKVKLQSRVLPTFTTVRMEYLRPTQKGVGSLQTSWMSTTLSVLTTQSEPASSLWELLG